MDDMIIVENSFKVWYRRPGHDHKTQASKACTTVVELESTDLAVGLDLSAVIADGRRFIMVGFGQEDERFGFHEVAAAYERPGKLQVYLDYDSECDLGYDETNQYVVIPGGDSDDEDEFGFDPVSGPVDPSTAHEHSIDLCTLYSSKDGYNAVFQFLPSESVSHDGTFAYYTISIQNPDGGLMPLSFKLGAAHEHIDVSSPEYADKYV